MDTKESEISLTFYPTEKAAQILRISTVTLRRDARILSSKLRGDFGRKRWARGYTPEQMAILTRYRELRYIGMTEEQAANHIRINGVTDGQKPAN